MAGHCCRASGRLSRRFCGLSFSTLSGVHRHRKIDRPAGDAPGACPPDRRSRAGTGTGAAPSAPRRSSTSLYRSLSSALASASRPTCHTQCASSIARSCLIVTSHAQEMRDPPLAARGQRVERRPAAIEADREVVALVALPVVRPRCRASSTSRSIVRERRAVLRQQLAQRAEAAGRGEQLDRGVVGRHHRAVLEHRDLLRPEQHLRRARFHRRRRRSPRMWRRSTCVSWCDEQRRHVDAVALEQRRRTPPRATAPRAAAARKRSQIAVVLARVGIVDRGELAVGTARRGSPSSASCSASSARARLANRRELGPHQVAAQEVVGDGEPPVAAHASAGDSRRTARSPARVSRQPPSIAFLRSSCTGLSPIQTLVSAC